MIIYNRYVIIAIVAVIVVVAVSLYSLNSTGLGSGQQQGQLSFRGVSNLPQAVNEMNQGISSNSFNITYFVKVGISGTPLNINLQIPVNLTLAKYSNLLNMHLIANASVVYSLLSPGSSVGSGLFNLWSIYNGTGSISCSNTNGSTGCQYTAETINVSKILGDTIYNKSNSLYSNASSSINNVSVSYVDSQSYKGNTCSLLSLSSRQSLPPSNGSGFSFGNFTSEELSGQICFSNTIGLPLFGSLTAQLYSGNAPSSSSISIILSLNSTLNSLSQSQVAVLPPGAKFTNASSSGSSGGQGSNSMGFMGFSVLGFSCSENNGLDISLANRLNQTITLGSNPILIYSSGGLLNTTTLVYSPATSSTIFPGGTFLIKSYLNSGVCSGIGSSFTASMEFNYNYTSNNQSQYNSGYVSGRVST